MATTSLKRKLVVIEDGLLSGMSTNSAMVKEFPVLSPIAAIAKSSKRSGCGSCSRAGQARAQTYQQVKQALAGMDAARKRKLKELLNTESIRILYKDSKGKTQQLTF